MLSLESVSASSMTRKAKVLGRGRDGRNIYTADADARAGHRSATNSRPAGPYIGYELHLAVQARDVRWTNYVDKVSMCDEVPCVVTCFRLNPGGTHRGRAIVDDLVARGVQPHDSDPDQRRCPPARMAPMWSTLKFLVLRRALGVLRLGPRPDDKDVEIAVL